MKIIFLILLTFLITNFTIAQNFPELSKSESGKRVLEYFKAFNSGDEQKLKEYFEQNLTPEAINDRPIERRLAFHKQLREDNQILEIKSVVSVNENEINLVVQGKTGDWIAYTFTIDKASQKLIGWQIEQTEPPSEITQINPPKTKEELFPTVEKYLNDLVAKDNFSGVVLIAKDDKPVFQKAYGLADKEKNISNNLETKFNLGSINKAFTRIAIGQLVTQGKISFSDKLGKYLPDYPNKEAAEKVTIGHLVTMKSGIGDFFGEEFDKSPKNKFRKNSDFIPLFSKIPLAFEPGTNEQYSNGGYILLGAIIEKVTGQSYYDYVKENIFKVAGMTNTDSFETDKTPSNTANGYTKQNSKDKWLNNIDSRPFKGSSAGGGYSTAQDLLNFSSALKSRKLIAPDDEGAPRKESGIAIAGGSVGINALLLVNTRNGYTIIVLSNYDPPSAEKTGIQIRDWIRSVE